MDAVRDKRETTHTLTHKKKRYEERESRRVTQQLQAAENECLEDSRRGKKKKEKERERDVEERSRRTREMEKAFWNFENFFFSF